MEFREKKLYHQVHPLKLLTDIGVTLISLYLLWRHRIWPAVCFGFLPPILVSALMMKWPPDLERIRDSKLGEYLRKYMTAVAELFRLLTLVPMAYGAWKHIWWPIWLGIAVLCAVWANGLLFPQGNRRLRREN